VFQAKFSSLEPSIKTFSKKFHLKNACGLIENGYLETADKSLKRVLRIIKSEDE